VELVVAAIRSKAGSVVLAAGLSLLVAPPSTVVMNALPASEAGDRSSLNFVSRFTEPRWGWPSSGRS
jgi:hypothetical protein